MATQWLGYTLSVDCGPSIGFFQGKVSSVDSNTQSVELTKVFKNGMPYDAPSVILSAKNIKKLDIIEEPQAPLEPVVELRKPIPKRPGRVIPEGQNFHSQPAPPRSLNLSHYYQYDNSGGFFTGEGMRSPNKRDRMRQKRQERDEACFGSPVNNGFDQDFDFEKNLALFDKQAVYDEIAIQRPDLVRQADGQRKHNYRHDENIIAAERVIHSTIIVPNPGDKEYVTDDGLVIPSMRPELLHQLHQKAEDYGLSVPRQLELMGRGATEICLQLLGGAPRLNPNNAHQWPTVVLMCGSHLQGAMGVVCARQLETQGISTIVYLSNPFNVPTVMAHELSLYRRGSCKIVAGCCQNLPESVDLIVMALAGHINPEGCSDVADWISDRRTPILALDPPPSGTPGIDAKFSIVPTLPLSHSTHNGKLYLCNLAIPRNVYVDMGIKYRSPFGSKFVIPLYLNDN